jgi:hypothetical protein
MASKERLNFTVEKGLHSEVNTFNPPLGSMLSLSENVIYDRNKVLKSIAAPNAVVSFGGNKVYVLDENFIGMMGKNITTKKATGNIVQASGRNLWFVGNSIADTDTVKVSTSFAAPVNIGALSSTPQLAKFNGSGWDTPVQVGLAPQTETPELILTTDGTRDAAFSGILTGSLSARLARKRNGTVSIASGASNVVTGETDSAYVTIPAYIEDGSDADDRVWLLYFTPPGFGSQYAHILFPIEIPEVELDGTNALGWTSIQGNAKVKVISQDASVQADRKIEVEFNINDLLQLTPFDDYYAAEACKFLAPLGNVMCLVGSGTDGTAFDVSYPNNREAYPPEWRDWLPEVPVTVVPSSEQGLFWVQGANTTVLARWTGATQQSAPVVLEQKSAKYGVIGERASVVINGVLYGLSSGKTLYRMTINGQVDDTFGNRVKNSLSGFTETAVLAFDEANNSLIVSDSNTSYEYQIDHDVWSSKVTTTLTNGISELFTINGKLYVSTYDSGGAVFNIREWDAGADMNWVIATAFQTGAGIGLKDIINLHTVISSGADTNPTITIEAYKDWSDDSTFSIATMEVPLDETQISKNEWIEGALDYRSISVRISGTLSGTSVHVFLMDIDHHTFEVI